MAGALAADSMVAAGNSLRGTVTGGAGDRKPLGDALVSLCEHLVPAPVLVNRDLPACDHLIASARSAASGAFVLKWSGPRTVLAAASLTVARWGYLSKIVGGKQLVDSPVNLSLSPVPAVQLAIVRPDGTPVSDAEYGWFAQDGPTLKIRHVVCCSPPGPVDLDADGVPEGEVTVFAIAPGRTPQFGTARIRTRPGQRTTVVVEVARPLLAVAGRAVTADGSPLAAVVSAEPIAFDPLGAFDRALLAIDGGPTDLTGAFLFRSTSAAPLRLVLSTWIPGQGTSSAHLATRPLAESEARPGGDRIVLRSSQAPVVACSLLDGRGRALPLSEVGLTFGPHLGWGHSGSCLDLSEHFAPGPSGAGPTTARFVWPAGARTVTIVARADERAAGNPPRSGSIVLRDPAEPCRLDAR